MSIRALACVDCAAGPRQIDDLLAWPAAIGGVGLVGQIDEVRLGQTLHEGAVDREAAHAGVEDAYGHALALARHGVSVHAACDGQRVQSVCRATACDTARRVSSNSELIRYI